MTGIYKIENKLNGKIYIGQALDIELRWEQHKDSIRYSTKSWYPEARSESHSIEDFEFTVLQECKPNELDEIETYWVKKYDSYNNGYNKTANGSYLASAGKMIIDLTRIRYITELQWYQCIKDMKGNDFKLFSYYHIKSQSYDFIPWSPTILEQEIGLGHKSPKLALDSLIELGYIKKEENKYIMKIA